MHRRSDLQVRLTTLSGGLEAITGGLDQGLAELEKLLLVSHLDDPAAALPRELSIDRALREMPAFLPDERGLRLSQLVDSLPDGATPEYRVFRRETPMAAPMVGLAAPAWGRGAQASKTLGPFQALDGRQFWFDFFPIIRMIPLYFDGDPQPAMLFFERDHLSFLSRLTHVHTLVKSSVWVRANLLAAGAPGGGYVGLQIEGGKLHFSVDPVASGGRLTMSAGSTCHVTLTVSPALKAAVAPGEAGKDASVAEMSTPGNFVFDLAAGHATPKEVGGAAWQVYGVAMEFDWDGKPAPAFEPLLQSVLIPMRTAQKTFQPSGALSPFAEPEGAARILQAAWTLPVSTLDIQNPTGAAGSGGLAIHTGKGLTLNWRGLREGPVRLPGPWIAGGPGLIAVIDPAAVNIYANQRFLLWMDSDSRFRSEVQARYSGPFQLTYLSAATGSELVLAQADVAAKLDRPVDVKGTPFPVHTLKSVLSLVYTDAAQFAFIYDDNILVDSLDPSATWPVERGKTISLAIRNALFTITPVNSFFLFAELEDAEMVRRATLTLGMGLYGILPSLPDPYAANVAPLQAEMLASRRNARPDMLLVGQVTWTKAAGDGADAVSTAFHFAPLGTQAQALAAWGEAGRLNALAAQGSVFSAANVMAEPPTLFSRSVGGHSNEGEWNSPFGRFDHDQFTLLDVSTNADQMGVGFSWFNERALADQDLVFYQMYKPTATGHQAAFPLQVRDLDLSAESRFVRALTLPQISWEPVFNLTPPPDPGIADPPGGWNLYPDDGGPTRLFNNSVELVPVAPIPVTEFLEKDFRHGKDGVTAALFTLPFGLRAFAKFSRENPFTPGAEPGHLRLFRPSYEGGDLTGALQLRADAPKHPVKSPTFEGATFQLNNVLTENGIPTFTTTLGASVSRIFNKEFFIDGPPVKPSGVPLSRIDFCGYGASMFSHWEDPSAAVAATSKAYFDVILGRTAQEVIQVRSLLYPWGVRVVRTITLTRASDGYVFRFDTGWQAESEGICDFRYRVFDTAYKPLDRGNPYVFHPGIVKGVFNVRNIVETSAIKPFSGTWNKAPGSEYLDSEGIARNLPGSDPKDANPDVFLQPVYFDADVAIEGVVSGAVNGRVPSKGMVGYVQLAPRGEPIPPHIFIALLNTQFGSLGGPVDCVIDIGATGQQMRLSRVDVNASTTGSSPLFVTAARGALLLPKDGAWSVVQHNQGTGEVSPLEQHATTPVIRRGKLLPDAKGTDTTPADGCRIANPLDLVKAPDANTRNFGLLQSTNTQKVLFRLPRFEKGVKQLKSEPPNFADAYRLVNTKGIFPKVQDTEVLNLGAFQTEILASGYKLVNPALPGTGFEHAMQKGPLSIINESFLKIYIEYGTGAGSLKYGFDSTSVAAAKQWLSKMSEVAMVVDLGPLKRLMTITGKFDTEKGTTPAFRNPQMKFSKELQPVVDILQILASLNAGHYGEAFGKGLQVAMSNSADSWNYALHAKQEIPLMRFPPPELDSPAAPLRLEAHMAIGVYFNEALAIPSAPAQLIPSAGAFLEFGGSLSVMCFSLAAATIYAVGQADLRLAADLKTGPSLHMKFGFGAQIAVGLPVVGTVSVLYAVGIQIDLDKTGVVVAAFLLYQGRAELLAGLVTVQIQIEAKGIVKDRTGDATEMAAQITFGLDVSIFLVINLHFSKSWEETRQIA